MVRRLPVLQTGPAPEPPRPAWQWVLIGAGFVLALWVPLLTVALWARSRLVSSSATPADLAGAAAAERSLALLAALAPILLTWMAAAALAGWILSRFAEGTRRRHAVAAGLVASVVACALALLGRAFDSGLAFAASLLALSLAAAAGAWAGTLVASRGRKNPRA